MKAISTYLKTLFKMNHKGLKINALSVSLNNNLNNIQRVYFSKKRTSPSSSSSSVLQQYVTNKVHLKEQEKDKNKISAKLLCELIGSKYYPTNDEIVMDPYNVVTVYDENDKLLGHMNFIDAKKYASELKKDIVLRNEIVKPPIVKIMKYRIVLLKRLIKKLSNKSTPSKTIAQEKEKSTKFILLSLNMNKNDLDHKIMKCKDYLSHFTSLRVAVKLDSNDKNETFRATNLLKNITKDLNEFASMKVPPTVQICKNLIERDEFDLYLREEDYLNRGEEDVKREQEDIKSAMDELKSSKREIDKNIMKYEEFENLNVMYIQLDSLVIDASGIDFEKLLETVNVEDLLKGHSNTNFIESLVGNQTDEKKKEPLKPSELKEESEVNVQDQLTKIDAREEKKHVLKIDQSKSSRRDESNAGEEVLKQETVKEKMRRAQIKHNLQEDISKTSKYMLFKTIHHEMLLYSFDIERKKSMKGGSAKIEEDINNPKKKSNKK